MTDKHHNAKAFKGKTGFRRLINATRYSMQGIVAAWKTEAAFREELTLCIVLLPLACLLPVSVVERVILIQSTLLVPMTEILNSALEACVDRFGNEIHPLAGRAKDMASAAVFFALISAAVAWAAIAGPILWDFVTG